MSKEHRIRNVFFKSPREQEAQRTLRELAEKRRRNPQQALGSKDRRVEEINRGLVRSATRRQFLAWSGTTVLGSAAIASGLFLPGLINHEEGNSEAGTDYRDLYPELGKNPNDYERFVTVFGKQVDVINFTDYSVNPGALKSAFDFYEGIASQRSTGVLEKGDFLAQFSTELHPAEKVVMFLTGEQDPNPSWAKDNPSGALTIELYNGSSLNLSSVVAKPGTIDGINLSPEDNANWGMLVEAAQSSFVTAAPTLELSFAAREVVANSFAPALILKQQRKDYRKYSETMRATHILDGYSPIILTEQQYTDLPVIPRVVSLK